MGLKIGSVVQQSCTQPWAPASTQASEGKVVRRKVVTLLSNIWLSSPVPQKKNVTLFYYYSLSL